MVTTKEKIGMLQQAQWKLRDAYDLMCDACGDNSTEARQVKNLIESVGATLDDMTPYQPVPAQDEWVAGCSGTEMPFETRTGRILHYMFNKTTGEHAYYDVRNDIFLSNDEAHEALGVN